MIKKNFQEHCDYLTKLCEKTNTKYHKYDVGLAIYPDGYGDIDNKNYFLIMIEIKNYGNKLGKINYEDFPEEELIKHLIDFKNGIIDNNFCLKNVTDYRNSNENENGLFTKYDYLER